jgi:hypothetical protein
VSDPSLWRMPAPSTGFEEGPVVRHQGDRLVVSYDYETPTGAYAWEDLVFTGVIAYTFVDDPACTAEQIDAYDQLVEVTGSAWLAGLLADRRYPAPGVRHLRIYFDDVGCLDVAASAFTPPPGRDGPSD